MTRCFLWKIVNCELPGKMTLRCGAAPAIHCIQKSAQRGALCIPTTNSTRLNLPLSPHSPDLRGHSPSPILQLYTAKNRWTPYPSYPYPPLPSSLCLCVSVPLCYPPPFYILYIFYTVEFISRRDAENAERRDWEA